MIKVGLHKQFRKHFRQRITSPKLMKRYRTRLGLFVIDPTNSILKDHSLTGKLKGLRAFSIAGDISVIYRQENPTQVTFIDIGTHNQVYQ